jgi:hypothetical protein
MAGQCRAAFRIGRVNRRAPHIACGVYRSLPRRFNGVHPPRGSDVVTIPEVENAFGNFKDR